MTYTLCTLDVTPDNEINDMWSTGTTFDLPEEPSVHEVCEALKGADRMATTWPEAKVKMEQEDNGDIWMLNHKGRKVYMLRRDA